MIEIDLKKYDTNKDIAWARLNFQKRLGDKSKYSDWDWARLSYVLDLTAQQASLLDVGVGSGQFINAAARSAQFSTVCGVDIRKHSKFIELHPFLRCFCTVEGLPFKDRAFDVVVCMEVLEHLEEPNSLLGLSELRRVCGQQLLVTVPFEEPLPLPSFHRQQFTSEKISRWFPNARLHLLKRSKLHWLLIEEQMTR